MTCPICDRIEKKKNMLFEDDKVFAMLSDEPWSVGHILVVPKKHFAILEQVPDDVMGRLFEIANKASMCVFEGLGAQGTNIIIQNGIPAGQKVNHVIVHVIPRFENDGLDLSWTPKQASDEELDAIEAKFREQPKQEAAENQAKTYKPVRRIP